MSVRLTTKNALVLIAVFTSAYLLLPSLTVNSYSKKKRKGDENALRSYTTGLINRGVTCYANSVLQALSSSDALLSFLNKNSQVSANEELYNFLKNVSLETTEPRSLDIDSVLMMIEIHFDSRLGCSQQDAHELLLKLIELLNDESKDHLVEDFPFSGLQMERIECCKCNNVKTKLSKVLVIEKMPGEDLIAPHRNLISEYNCSNCCKNKETSTVIYTQFLVTVPQILVVHINRSMMVNSALKNTQSTNVPLSVGNRELSAIVFHSGDHNSGHYYCARRKRKATSSLKKWWLISDEKIEETTFRNISRKVNEAYLLFYEAHREYDRS